MYRITYHEQDDKIILRYQGDAQALVDACAKEARANRERPKPVSAKNAGMRRMMALDPVVMMSIAHEHGIPYWDLDAIFKIAHDRDYSKFRCVDDKRFFQNSGRKIIVGA